MRSCAKSLVSCHMSVSLNLIRASRCCGLSVHRRRVPSSIFPGTPPSACTRRVVCANPRDLNGCDRMLSIPWLSGISTIHSGCCVEDRVSISWACCIRSLCRCSLSRNSRTASHTSDVVTVSTGAGIGPISSSVIAKFTAIPPHAHTNERAPK